jgi:glycosyltransferase involved in cell wall biosynthesis
VCNVARLSLAQKRQDVLIRAIQIAQRDDARVRALLVGSGPDEVPLRELVGSLGLQDVVRFVGHRTDVGCVLRAADLYVHCSSWEGLGFAVVEAMEAGLPIIASDIPVMREVVGNEVELVPVGDDLALSRQISRMRGSPESAARLGRSLRARWTDAFSLDGMVTAHEDLYRGRMARSEPK